MNNALDMDSQFFDNVIANPNLIYDSKDQLKKMLSENLQDYIDAKSLSKLDLTQIWTLLEKRLSNEISNFKETIKSSTETEIQLVNEIKNINKRNQNKFLNNKRKNEDNIDNDQDQLSDDEKEKTEVKKQKNNKEKQKKTDFFNMKEYQKIGEEGLRPEDYKEDDNLEDEDEGELEDQEEENIDPKNINYEDFFDSAGKGENEDINDDEDDEVSVDIENDIFKKENEFLQSNKQEVKALINESLTNDIDKIEKKMISDKPWQMKGEVGAKDRKKGSLLEQVIEHQVSIKPPPIPTPKYTNDIESIIIQRVKDGMFDNPVRKELVDIEKINKKGGEMKFEKSKKGLAEIYEDQFTETVNKMPNEAEQDNIKKEINELETKLFTVLDRLTNFNSVPKINKEMKVITNVPSIALEDISNHVTDNKQFTKTPQELYNLKDTNFESRDELNKDEKQRVHNQKKRNIRTHLRQKLAYNKLKNIYDSTNSKFEAKMEMKKLKDKKANKETKVSDLKSGKFFSSMQKIVSNDISKKNDKHDKINKTSDLKIKKFKL